MTTCYPIEYRMISTQYSFLVSKEHGRYRVQVQPVTKLINHVFDTEEEAREFINVKQII